MQEGREAYGAHTVKRRWTGRACGTHKRGRSEGRSKGKKVVARKKPKKQKKAGRNVCEKKVKNFLTHTLGRIDRPAEPRRL